MSDDTIKLADVIELGDALKLAKKALKAKEKAEKAAAGATGPDAVIKQDLKTFGNWVRELKLPYSPRSHTFKYMSKDRSPSFIGRVAGRALVGSEFAQGSPELIAYLYADLMREAYVTELRNRIPLGGSDSGNTFHFLRFLLQRQPSELDINVFKQFIWQIKRRIHEKQTEWEMMPLFTGGQGWGKTRHLRRIWAAIPAFETFVAKGQRFKIFTDDFGRAIFNQCYVIPFEEMSGAKTTDIETLKMFITEDEVQARIMRAEQFQVMRLNATFYGTSNLPGGASLNDSTGMRRFWEFQCPDMRFDETIHASQLDAIDFAAIWSDVDATTDASPIRPYVSELMAEQVRQFAKSGALHDFFEERIEYTGNPEHVLSRSETWSIFVEWREGQHYPDKLNKNSMSDYVRKVFGEEAMTARKGNLWFTGFRFRE